MKKKERVLDFFKSRVWLSNSANLASLELCIYSVFAGGKRSGMCETSRVFAIFCI